MALHIGPWAAMAPTPTVQRKAITALVVEAVRTAVALVTLRSLMTLMTLTCLRRRVVLSLRLAARNE